MAYACIRIGFWALPLVLTCGCISSTPGRYPLYKHTGSPLPREQVAELAGYVQFVDGRDVSQLGSTLELLPGCHVIQTPNQWGHTELNQGGVSWTTGHITYAIQMKANGTYAIRVQGRNYDGTHYRGMVTAAELNPDGSVARTFNPVRPDTCECPAN